MILVAALGQMTGMLILLIAAMFLVPLVANLVGTTIAVAGAAADILTRSKAPIIRLWAVGGAVSAAAMSWSATIVWISNHTILAYGTSPILQQAVAVILAVIPTLFVIRAVPGGIARASHAAVEGNERRAVQIAAVVNAIFVLGVLALQHSIA